jgi:hypothetical protein
LAGRRCGQAYHPAAPASRCRTIALDDKEDIPVKTCLLILALLFAPLFVAGCSEAPAPGKGSQTVRQPEAPDDEAEARAGLAELPPADRKQAEAQKFCAVQTENLLGSMGVPVKVLVKGQPVFLCCKGCRKKALADPDRTLARVDELRRKNAGKAP